MSEVVSARTRSALARSLPLVRQHKEEIVDRMGLSLRRIAGKPERFDKAEATATILTSLLLRQADLIVYSGRPADLDAVAHEHRSAGIDGRHYSRFGDVLAPILKDVLGARTPREVVSAWSDTFWQVIRASQSAEEPVEA